jgi:uncharacterized protein (DUF58 family)
MATSAPLLDRAFLEKLERLTLQWQKSFRGLVGGHNLSRFSGPGQEFLDHRNFHQGDDLRAVNWRAYLRLDKLFLKMFEIEPRVPVRLLVDASDSMTAAGGEKFDYARRLAGALCYVGLVRHDSIEIHAFHSKLGQRYFCSGGRHRFAAVADCLMGMRPEGRTDFLAVVREFLSMYAQRGLLILISDFLDDAGCEKPLQYLGDFGHELMLVHVWSEEDRTPPWTGELELVDAETRDQVKLHFDEEARRRYTAAFDEYCNTLQQIASRNGGRYVGVSTGTPLEEVMFGSLVRAKGLA